jgi:hypothetical protein
MSATFKTRPKLVLLKLERYPGFQPTHSNHKIGYDQRGGKSLVDGRVAYGAEAIPERKSNRLSSILMGEG